MELAGALAEIARESCAATSATSALKARASCLVEGDADVLGIAPRNTCVTQRRGRCNDSVSRCEPGRW